MSDSGYTSPRPPGAGGELPAPDAPAAGGLRLSGWWRRVGAAVVDGVIIVGGAVLFLIAMGAIFSIGVFGDDGTGVVAVIVGLSLGALAVALIAFLYAPLMMARTNGQTLGRMATGIRVVRTSGEPMSFGLAVLREVVIKTLLFAWLIGSLTAGLGWLLDVLWPLWDEENRALHDFLARTRVVRA